MKTRIFHLGDYRRATIGPGQDVPDDYFFVNGKWNNILAAFWSIAIAKYHLLCSRGFGMN